MDGLKKISNVFAFTMLVGILTTVVTLTGCSHEVKIEDILKNPSKYYGQDVTILEGGTSNAFWMPELGKGGYQIQGTTGVKIWVVTTSMPPQQFEYIKLKGTVAKNVTLGDRVLEPVIIERNRRLIYHYPSPSGTSDIQSWQIGEGWYYGQQAIWGDVMVALELVHDEHYNVTDWYLSTYNLVTQEKQRLIEVPADRIYTEPAIYEDKIVWSVLDRSEAEQQPPPRNYDILNWDIFLYDLTTGETRQLTTDIHAQVHPGIYGDIVVWLDNRHEATDQYPHPYDVYAFDLKTNQEKRVTSATTAEGYGRLSISGNAVVWSDIRHADPQVKSYPSNSGEYNNEIYLFDLVANQEHRITSNPANDHYPCIDGTRIIWLRQIDYLRADVFAYELATGMETQVSQSGYATHHPSISGSRIVWQDARASNGNTSNDAIINGQAGASDIYLYDLQTMTETNLTSLDEKGNKLWAWPIIHEDYVAYSLDRMIGPITYALRLPGGK